MKSLLALSGFAAYCGFSYATRGITEVPDIHEINSPDTPENPSLKLLTLNIAHGRGTSLNHQLFMRRSFLKKNLNSVADLIKREAPDFCALQESDARTFYSNELHQSRYLATESNMASYIQGRHVNGMNFIYGTALLCKKKVDEPLSIAFDFKPPNPTKGVVLAQTEFRGQKIDIVSLHLDFMRKKLRLSQVESLINVLNERKNPAVIMGDFNSEWTGRGSLRSLCEELNLKPWNPSEKTPTFLKLKKRLDWILIPNDFNFNSYKVLEDKVSDHQPVLAEISF